MLLWSGVGGQLLSHHLLWSGVGGQLLSHHLLWLGVGGQLLSYHLLWSGVGGQLLSYHAGGQYCTSSLEGPFRGAFGKKNTIKRIKILKLLKSRHSFCLSQLERCNADAFWFWGMIIFQNNMLRDKHGEGLHL